MAGTYEIVKKVSHPSKFACYVKFNEALDAEFYNAEKYPEGGEYWEHDSLDPAEVAVALQATADADDLRWTEEDEVSAKADAIEVKNGKVVIPK